MSDLNSSIYTLEFDKIRELLAQCCHTQGAVELAYRLEVSDDAERVQKLQAQTTEAKELEGVKGIPPFSGVIDVNPSLDRAEKGAVLSTRELLDIANLLTTTRRLIDYINDGKDYTGELKEIFDRLNANRPLEDSINRVILAEDMISDEASPELADIRRKMRVTANKIKDTMSKFTSGAYTKYLQENIITQRGGRFVVPVKAEYKNEIKGLTHDISASGATLFIEPMAVVEANNALRELESAEKHEIDRILAELSANAANNSGMLSLNYYNITALAFIFAKAELSYKMDGTSVRYSEKQKIELYHARHPLLDKEKIVPINVRLGSDFDTLVITGPNTGGKTVTLKTLGLFALMYQAGLHIPADDTSVMPVFTNVLADIGDEQSIEQSLSTFSAHMKNIVGILEKCDSESLVLFDELGAGTDPLEGAALAEAILEKVRSFSSLCAATTHYAELKEYALNTEGVSNASCEFDVQTLRPTYKLIIGTPGKSNAFAISSRLGLDDSIIDRAREKMSGDSQRFEETIDKLERARIEMEALREDALKMKRDAEKTLDEANKKAEKLTKETEKQLSKERAQSAQMLQSARVSSEFIFTQLAQLKKETEEGRYSKKLEEQRDEIRKKLRDSSDNFDPVERIIPDEEYRPPRPYKKGDDVVVVNINQDGVLLTDPDGAGNVNVQIGVVKMKTNVSNLMLIDGKEVKAKAKKKEERSTQNFHRTVSENFRMELDLRGKNSEEAFIAIDKYLDEAKLARIENVRIVHGKGTGVLRKAVQDYLSTDSRVKSWRIGQYGEGDTGVTVVTLK